MAGLTANIESTWSMTLRVRSTDVAGGMEMVQNKVPVSSLGTRPVFVIDIVPNKAAIPITTAMIMATGLRTNFSTHPLYLPSILL